MAFAIRRAVPHDESLNLANNRNAPNGGSHRGGQPLRGAEYPRSNAATPQLGVRIRRIVDRSVRRRDADRRGSFRP
jgi:hypothetical protein